MFVVLHVTIALSSMGYATYMLFSPSTSKFYVSYGLVALTLISGTYLIISTHSRLLPACISGLVYLGIMFVGIVAAHIRFKRVEAKVPRTDKFDI
jgi:hypothetical protein